jgi:hypothetical protein
MSNKDRLHSTRATRGELVADLVDEGCEVDYGWVWTERLGRIAVAWEVERDV